MTFNKLTPEIIADIKTPRGPCLSPDGKHVVYTLRSFWVRQTEHITASIWIAEVGKEKSARQLTSGTYHDMSPMFSPDGKQISFLSDRAKPGSSSHLYLLPFEGGETVPLSDTGKEKGIYEYKWNPKGKSIAFTSTDETSAEKKQKAEAKNDANVYGEGWEFNRLRTINIQTKEVITVFEKAFHVTGLVYSPDGNDIAFATYQTPQFDDWLRFGATMNVVNVESKKARVVCRFPTFIQHITWHKDVLLWISSVPDPSGNRVHRVSVMNDEAEVKYVAYGENECPRDLKSCGNETVLWVQEGLSDQLRILGSKLLFSEEADICGAWDALIDTHQTTLVIIKGAVGVMEELFSVVDGKTCQLSSHNKDFTDFNIGEGQTLRCKAEDGLVLDGVICIPKSLNGKKGPHRTAVIVHGGPYLRVTLGSDWCFQWATWMLSLGYVVLMPNYRGSSAYGNEYASKVQGDVDASYGDVIALVKQGIKEGIVDPDKVAITGWSHGGFLTYLSVTRESTFHFAAGIAGAGITHWDLMMLTTDNPTYYEQLIGSAPWKGKQDQNRNANPIFFVRDVQTPLLILHGENDARVPKDQALGFHRGMLAYNKDCTLVMYPREGHGFPLPFERAHYIDMLTRIKDFLGKHLG